MPSAKFTAFAVGAAVAVVGVVAGGGGGGVVVVAVVAFAVAFGLMLS